MERIELLDTLISEYDRKVEEYRNKYESYKTVRDDHVQERKHLLSSAYSAGAQLIAAAQVKQDGVLTAPANPVIPNEQVINHVAVAPQLGEFTGKTQAEAARILISRSPDKTLHIGDIVSGLEEGGLEVGGHNLQKQKDNLSSSLSRSGGFSSKGAGLWTFSESREGVPSSNAFLNIIRPQSNRNGEIAELKGIEKEIAEQELLK